MTQKHALGVVCLMATLAACGQAEPDLGAHDVSREVADATVLASLRSGNGPVRVAPADILDGADFVVVGEVAAIHPGPVVKASYSDGTADLDHFALVEVSLAEALVDQGEVPVSDRVFVRLKLGVEGVDAEGEYLGTGPVPVLGLDDFAEALPIGTRVVVSGVHHEVSLGDRESLAEAGYAVPEGATETSGTDPQLFAIETGEDHVTGWGDRTFDDLVAALRAAATH